VGNPHWIGHDLNWKALANSKNNEPPKTNPSNTPSRSSPKGGSRACLCEDNTYHVKCCEGYLLNQGIGAVWK
jgi:hypothetical protein